MEVYLLRKGVSFSSMQSMSEREVLEYIEIFQVFDELESESMKGNI